MAQSYTPEEAREIDRNYFVVMEGVERLHPKLAGELDRAFRIIADEVGDPALARVLITSEMLRGINRDERPSIDTSSFVISPRLRGGLEIAHTVGGAVAPFALRNMQSFLRRKFGRRPPQLSQRAKEAILRCQMVHAMSRNGAKWLVAAG